MRIRVIASALIGCALSLSACANTDNDGDAAPADLAFSDDSIQETASTLVLIESIPDVDLTEDELQMVVFEANWVCELQRRTFSSPGAMQVALDGKLADLGVPRSDYDAFRSEVNSSQDLRDSVLYAYQESCLG